MKLRSVFLALNHSLLQSHNLCWAQIRTPVICGKKKTQEVLCSLKAVHGIVGELLKKQTKKNELTALAGVVQLTQVSLRLGP